MKTDDYKQELHISATLCRTNVKKNIFVFKKSSHAPQKLLAFFQSCCERCRGIGAPIYASKKALLREEPYWIVERYFEQTRCW